MKTRLLLLLILLLNINCSLNNVVKHHGVHFLDKKQTKLKITETNKNDTRKILGPPSTESSFDNDIWIYIENHKSKSSLLKLGKNVELANNVLVLEIDNRGILKNKKYYNINDQNKINFSKDETKMSDKDSFVYDFMSSIRQKIDNPKKNK